MVADTKLAIAMGRAIPTLVTLLTAVSKESIAASTMADSGKVPPAVASTASTVVRLEA